jgi:hypothetical protein
MSTAVVQEPACLNGHPSDAAREVAYISEVCLDRRKKGLDMSYSCLVYNDKQRTWHDVSIAVLYMHDPNQ